MAYESRSEIDPKYTWDLSDIFVDEATFVAALEDARGLPAKYTAWQERALVSAQDLLAFMQFDDENDIALGKLVNYSQRKSDEDTRDSHWQDLSDQVMACYVEISSASSWFTSAMLEAGETAVEAYYAQEPALELYRRSFDRIFERAAHTLSPAEERLLASAGEMAAQPENVFSIFNDADLVFEPALDSCGTPHEVTHGSYIPLMMSSDRTLRQHAFESLYGIYGRFRNTSAAILNAQMKQQKFYADARKYGSTLEHALAGTEIPCEVYTNLIEAVHENLPAMYKYVALRRKLLGLDELHFYDLYAPMVSDVDMKFTYEEACEIILAALEPMGEEYLALVRQGLSERWIDVYETPGKRSGGYSAGGYSMHPVILLNFQGTLDDVFTLIHEMGHSIHTYLSCKGQHAHYSSYVIFVAEVASTCNEALLMHYLLERETDKRKKAYLLNHYLEQFRGTLYRQTMFAEFELKVNEMCAQSQGITADALCELYRDLNALYFGDGIVLDDEIALEWSRIPHFYYEYYVYQYATGYAAAIALSNRILAEGSSAVKDYVGFLSGGCSKPPLELLRGAGVDMATTAPITSALKLFDSLIDQMDELASE